MTTSAPALIEGYDLALCDLDGVAFHGAEREHTAINGIAAAREAGLRFLFVTNNAMRTPGQVAQHLSERGIPTEADDVLTSAMAAAHLCASLHPGALVLGVGGDGLREALRNEGLRLTDTADDNPDVVVQGLDRAIGWPELSEATLAVRAGADFIATNLDTTLPTERGFAIGNGSLVAAVVSATGVQPKSTGKPDPQLFISAAEARGARRPLGIGDRLDTDIRGSRAAAYDCVHVLTGVSTARDVCAAPKEDRPTYLLVDLRELTLPYTAPQVALDEEAAHGTCRGARVRVNAETMVVREGEQWVPLTDGATVSVHAYRALAACTWALRDAGRKAALVDFTVESPQ
ncbi:MAG: HAD-IIA family hydrolase [Bowdeniella nasicola]|nr:HAD-IIA family hydrolase [Bowdeniella nasicola]